MTLEELKQAMDAAKAKAAAAPDDKALQIAAAKAEKAYNDAKDEADLNGGSGNGTEGDGGGNGNENSDELDETKLDEKTKAYLAKLRKENGKHRTSAKDAKKLLSESEAKRKAILKAAGIEDESEDPKARLEQANAQSQTLAFRNAILESAVDHGIPKDQLEYYEFLITKATNELSDGEELEDDKLAEIVAKCKKSSSGKAANSTVGQGGAGNGAPNPKADDKITLEKFCSMGIMAKSALFTKSPDLYATLMAEAKAKKKLV